MTPAVPRAGLLHLGAALRQVGPLIRPHDQAFGDVKEVGPRDLRRTCAWAGDRLRSSRPRPGPADRASTTRDSVVGTELPSRSEDKFLGLLFADPMDGRRRGGNLRRWGGAGAGVPPFRSGFPAFAARSSRVQSNGRKRRSCSP